MTTTLDLLDDFSATAAPIAYGNVHSPSPDMSCEKNHHPSISEDEAVKFDKQLQEKMAALMSEADESLDMNLQMELIMKEIFTNPIVESHMSGEASGPSLSSSADNSFHHTIRETMERIHISGEKATETTVDSEDVFARILREMQEGNLENVENESDISNMLARMMDQLTTKDILWEPVQELYEKYPAWIIKNKPSIKEVDLRRYEDQQRLISEMLKKFNEKDYSDSNPVDRKFILERMQRVITGACSYLMTMIIIIQ